MHGKRQPSSRSTGRLHKKMARFILPKKAHGLTVIVMMMMRMMMMMMDDDDDNDDDD